MATKYMHIEMRKGTEGLRACIAGTRIDVWLIIQDYQECDKSLDRLTKIYPMLTEEQLLDALAYYEENSEVIDQMIRDNKVLADPQKARELYPELFRSS